MGSRRSVLHGRVRGLADTHRSRKAQGFQGDIGSPMDGINIVHVHIISSAPGGAALVGCVASPDLAHSLAVARFDGHYYLGYYISAAFSSVVDSSAEPVELRHVTAALRSSEIHVAVYGFSTMFYYFVHLAVFCGNNSSYVNSISITLSPS